jgi:hypothetical protein
MIEGEHAIKKHQHTIWDAKIVFGVLSDTFEAAHNVIRTISDRSGRERRQPFDRRRTMLP